jgi:antitoxin YefM
LGYVTFTDLRNNLATHLDKVVADRAELVVTRQNRESVVVVPLAEWEGMLETLHLLSTPANAEHLRKSIEQLDASKGVEHKLIES